MLPAGARVVVPEIEFTSNLFPWLVHADRGVTVDTVPLEKLADAIRRGHHAGCLQPGAVGDRPDRPGG
jgi:hypothetical protein